MKVRKLDNNGDFCFGNGYGDYLTGSDAIVQCIKTKLRCLKGDWVLNTEEGIDWLYYLNNPSLQLLLEEEIKNIVASTEGVIELTELKIELLNKERILNINIGYVDKYQGSKNMEYSFDNR